MKNDSNDRKYITHLTADEAKTMRRCQRGELVRAEDLLMMVSSDMLLMQERVNNILPLAPPHGLSQDQDRDFWTDLNELYVELSYVNEYCQRWRAEETGEPQREVVEWKPSRLPDDYDA
jgi:hypothetical protein